MTKILPSLFLLRERRKRTVITIYFNMMKTIKPSSINEKNLGHTVKYSSIVKIKWDKTKRIINFTFCHSDWSRHFNRRWKSYSERKYLAFHLECITNTYFYPHWVHVRTILLINNFHFCLTHTHTHTSFQKHKKVCGTLRYLSQAYCDIEITKEKRSNVCLFMHKFHSTNFFFLRPFCSTTYIHIS